MEPTVSIVIPVYNNKELVRIMIESIIAQTYQYWELILVDDGSDKETQSLLIDFQQSNDRIIYLRRTREPKGSQACRNIGCEHAKGRYILFFDSDDYIAPYCLAQRVDFMEKNPNLDFAVFPAVTFRNRYDDGEISYGLPPKNSDDLFLFLLPKLPFVVWNNIYRKESLEKVGLKWDEKVKSLQDSDYNIQGLLLGLKYEYAITCSNVQADYYYRICYTDSSITKQIECVSHYESHLYLYQKNINNVRKKFGDKYDEVLRNRSHFFYQKIIKGGKISFPYLHILERIVCSTFKGGHWLAVRFKIHSFLYINCKLRRYRFYIIFFPSLWHYCNKMK